MLVSFLIILISLFFVCPQSSLAFIDGSICPVLPVNPEIITTCEQLQNISVGSTGYFVLGNDIDCSTITNFTPIIDFYGKFDGNNHSIKKLKITKDGNDYTALFGTIFSSAVISNLKMEDVDITGGSNVGGLIGSIYSTSNSECNISTIDNINVSGVISGYIAVGGLGGSFKDVNITNSSFNGDINGNNEKNGGLVGVLDCYPDTMCSITNSHSSGKVTSDYYNIGGLIGYADYVDIVDSYSTSLINGSYSVGGLVGYLSNSNIDQSYSIDSLIDGNFSDVGGLIGYSYRNVIDKSYSTNTVSGGGDHIGGLIGYSSYDNITKSYSTGKVSNSGNYIGGLIGFMRNSHLEDSYSTSNVSTTYNQEGGYLGGLVGYDEIYEEPSCSSIIRSYSSGTLTADPIITTGGLTGGVKGDPITDSFTTSQDTSGNYLALNGVNIDNSSTIINSFGVTPETPVTTFTNRSSPVFTNWDFSTVWLGTSGLPSFSDIVIPSSDSNSVSIYTDSPGTPDCQNLRLRAPDLFQINTTKNSAKLFFTPIDTNQFYISFSTNPNAEENGELVTLSKEGVQSHSVYHLKPNTTYYIKVRGQNGCMPGKWSDILTFKTNSTIFYKYVSKSTSAVKSLVNKITSTPTPTPTLIPTSTIKPTSIPTSTQPVKSNSTPTSKKCFLWWCW